MNDNETDSHIHEWRVALRVKGLQVVKPDGTFEDTVPALILRCGSCGALGMVPKPSPVEMRRATKPYRWFAHHRIVQVIRQTANGPRGTEWDVEK